ncbi:unnamed protein product [Paramecium primaurelia]|uniref:Transmembrane protein n=1 Tax=Paramecium primaurelia TaxID=5886 RepID=A0A8S1NEN1_PARPR|nr:unnamed protein product [Paramecium primaurelia]
MMFAFFCLTSQVLAYLSLELGQTYNDAIIPWQGEQNYKYYQIDIKNAIKNKDLIIVVKQQSTIGNPDIYISSLDQKPNKNYSEFQCNSQGMDICVIPEPENKTYYLAVYCEDYCRYNLKVVYQEELIMSNSDDLEFKFNNTSWTEIIRININQLKQYPIKQNQNLEVSIQVKNVEILQESFQSYMNLGMQRPTPQKCNFKGQDTFLGIQKFKINDVKANQTYTLLIEAQSGAIMYIKTRTYGSTKFINVGESIEDVIQENDYAFYVLNVTADQELFYLGKLILNIQLISFKGYTEMYVNLDENPVSLEDYHWKLHDGVTDDLIITNEDLNRLNAKGYYVYIAILAKQSVATFELKTQMLNPDLMVIELNKPVFSKMSKSKIHQYKFYIKSNKKQSVSVSLRNIRGDADIVVKSCNEFWSCNFNEEEQKQIISQNFTNNITDNQYYYSFNPGNDIIIFDYLPVICKNYDNVHMCFYSILIIPGNNNVEDELTYSILITTKQDTIILKENTPIKQFVFHEFYNYYKFTVNDNDKIQRLFIQLTPIQGSPKIYSSKTDIYPTEEYNDRQGVQNLITYDDQTDLETINGTIYIGVYGETASQYIITAIVFRKQEDWGTIGKYAHQYIQLIEGQPQEIVTVYKYDVQLFKIDLSGYNNENSLIHNQIKIFLRINSGQFKIYAFDHPEIDLKKAIQTGSKYLIINNEFQNNPQYLFIRVETNQSTTYPLYSYSINFRVSSQPIELVIGDNYQGFIEKSDKQTFFVNLYKKEDIYINFHVQNIDETILSATIYIEDRIIIMKDQNMILSANQIKYENCKKTEEIVSCLIVIEVQSREDTQFSLLISKESSIIKLYNEEPITKTITNQFDFFTFLLTEETEIAIFSITANIRILANIKQLNPPTLEEFPINDDDSLVQSLNDKIEIESSIFISQDDIEKSNCYNILCYVAVTCTTVDPLNKDNGEYTIIRQSGAVKLFEKFIYSGKINQNLIKYFKVVDVKESTGLQIFINSSEMNKLTIFASINQMPTQQSHDFSSSFNFGDYLLIPPNIDSDQIVTYYIGVFAFSDINVSIYVKMGLARFYPIFIQKPLRVHLPSNSTTFLQFNSGSFETLRILISSNSLNEYIKPKIHIKSYQRNELSSVLNTIQNEYHWRMEDYYIEISNTSENYCENCQYMIYLENNYQDILLTLTILKKDSLIQLQNNLEIKNLLKFNQFDRYLYAPKDQGDFYLNVTVFKGKIYLYEKKDDTDLEYSNLRLILEENDGTLDHLNYQVASREGINANRSLRISNLKENYNLSVYEFKVFSNFTSQTIYQVEIIDQNQAIELKIGQPQYLKINQHQQAQLYFIIPNRIDNYNDDYYSITIEITSFLHDRIIRAPAFTLKQDRYNNPDIQSNYHDFFNAQISVLQELDTITYIQIPSIAGLYFLSINPQEMSNQQYFIMLGNKDFNILTPKSYRLIRTKVGEQQIQEIHIKEPSKLFVQAQLCGGIVNIFGSSSRDNLIMGYYENKIDSIQNKQLIGTISTVQPNIYYLNTKTIKSTTQSDFVSYILRFDIIKEDTIVPIDHFYPGDGGEFQISLIQNQLYFYFSPIQSSEKSSQNYVLESITYTFIYQQQNLSDNSPLDKCNQNAQYEQFTIRRSKHDPQQTLTQRANYEGDNYEKILATIQATVNIKTKNYEKLKLSYFYNTQILEAKIVSNNVFDEFSRGLFTILFTLLLFILFLLLIKYRNFKQMIKFEAQTQVSSTQQEQQIEMNYTNLG